MKPIRMLPAIWIIVALHVAGCAANRGMDHAKPREVSFPTPDGGLIYANEYGTGPRGVVMVHGGRFDKESWDPQARVIAGHGYRVVAIDMRYRGKSSGPGNRAEAMSLPLHLDVLGAVRYMRHTGATSVQLVGGSLGGGAAGDASIEAEPGEINSIVFLGSYTSLNDRPPEQVKGKKLFIMSRYDTEGENTRRLPKLIALFERTPAPSELVVIDGSAHAQFIFQTDQSERAMKEILRFLDSI